jgi:hypothetical protein
MQVASQAGQTGRMWIVSGWNDSGQQRFDRSGLFLPSLPPHDGEYVTGGTRLV